MISHSKKQFKIPLEDSGEEGEVVEREFEYSRTGLALHGHEQDQSLLYVKLVTLCDTYLDCYTCILLLGIDITGFTRARTRSAFRQ